MASGRYGAVFGPVHRLFGGGSIAGMGEGELIRRFVIHRDPLAFEGLVTRHGPMVLGVCRRILSDPHDVEDAFQATFLILVKKAASLRDPDLLGPWLHGVAHRVAVRSRANAARRRSKEQPGVEEAAMVAAMNDASSDRHELRALLDEEIARLPERFRRPVILCYLEGLTHDEAAVRLKCPVGTVRSRMSTAREKLRNRLSKRGVTLPATLFGAALMAEAARAAVPQILIDTTVSAAIAYAATGTSATLAGTVSAGAASLAEGVTNTMFVNTLKLSGAAILTAMLTVGGAGAVAWQAGGEGKAQVPVAKPVEDAPKPLDAPGDELAESRKKVYWLQRKYDELQQVADDQKAELAKERAKSLSLQQTLDSRKKGDAAKPVQYALIGKMDIDKDGDDDRAVLKKKIEWADGIVAYDLPPFALGEVSGNLSPSIAYYVHDFENLPPGSEKNFQEKAIQSARNLGIRPISVKTLLAQLDPPKAGAAVENAKTDVIGDKEEIESKKRIEELHRKIDELTKALDPINEEVELTNQLRELEEQVKTAKAQLAPKSNPDPTQPLMGGAGMGGLRGGLAGMPRGRPDAAGAGITGGLGGRGGGGMGSGGGMGGGFGKGQAKKTSVVTLENAHCIIVQKPDGEKISAYSVATGKWWSYTIPKGVTLTPLMGNNLVVFAAKGEDVRQLVAYNPTSGRWCKFDLPEPTKEAMPIVSDTVAAYAIGRRVYAFSVVTEQWDVAELEEGAKPIPVVWPNRVTVESKNNLYVFSGETGKWSHDEANPAVVTPSGKIVTPPKD